MIELDITMQAIGITTPLDKVNFTENAKSYVDAIIANLENRFPQVKTLTLLGYLDPRNVQQSTTAATPLTMLEKLHIDGHKLWQEYIGYKSFVESLPSPVCLETAIHVMYSPTEKQWHLLTHLFQVFWHGLLYYLVHR